MAQEDDNNIVKTGMAASVAITAIYVICSYVIYSKYIHLESSIIARLILAVKSCIVPAFMLFLGIIVLGASRYGNKSQDPTQCESKDTIMSINIHYLRNTQEQLLLFIVNISAFCVYLEDYLLLLVPIYSSLFVLGRITFWVGYHYHPLYRATGFGMSFYPSVMGMIYNTYQIIRDTYLYLHAL